MEIAILLVALLASAPVPANNPGNWVNSEDYPKEALAADAEGLVVFKLEIKNDGLPSKCIIVESAGNASLDKATCDLLMARAKFEAVGDAGYSTKNTYQNRVRWAIPASEAEPPLDPTSSYGAAASFAISDRGEMGICESTITGQMPEFFDMCKAPKTFFAALAPLSDFKAATLRFSIQPADGPKLSIDDGAGKRYNLLYAATFDVLASGEVTNCVETARTDTIAESLCSAFQPGQMDFVPDPARTTPVRMQIAVDLTATRRN